MIRQTVWLLVAVVSFNMHTGNLVASITATLRVVDEKSTPLPCRVHLRGPAGEPVRPAGLPFWKDHFCCHGTVELKLSPGSYVYEIERGPEHESLSGRWDVADGASADLTLTLKQLEDLTNLGWYAGDLHVHRQVSDMPLLMAAENLHVAPVITWWNATNPWASEEPPATNPGDAPGTLHTTPDGRLYDVMGGEDERGGGALLYFGLARPLSIANAEREYPCSMAFLQQAIQRSPRPWIDVEKPFWRDVPLWLASGEIDSIGIAHNHLWRSGGLDNEAWGRSRDAQRWPGPQGNGRWTQEIYYHALNTGLRIPPSAGSASGVLPNPVGYNRCYVHLDNSLTFARWWEGLRAGRVFVTNGPLLLVTADERMPGHVFQAEQGPLQLTIRGRIVSREPIAQLEIIHDGLVVKTLAGSEQPEFEFATEIDCRRSGWFLIRAIVDNASTFRFASTGPFYVEIGGSSRPIDRRSAEFFLDWAEARRAELATLLGSPKRADVLTYHDLAIKFWTDLLQRALLQRADEPQ